MIRINKYFVPYIILLFYLGYKGSLIIAFFMVILHELVHYMVARYLGFYGFDIEIFPLGVSLNLNSLEDASINEDIIIALAGPLFNILLSIIFYFLYKINLNSYVYILYKTNLVIGLFNLIPAFPLDGGRILRDILCMKTFYRKASKITIEISIFIGFSFMVLYIILFMKNYNNFNLGIVSIFIIVSSLKDKERIAYIIMTHIVKKRAKFIKKGYIENRIISIYFNNNLLEALSFVDKNKYCIFTVLDDDMSILDTICEQQIINALKVHGNITLKQLIYNKNKDKNYNKHE